MPGKMIFPSPIKKGDTIAIISPATTVKPEYIDGLCRELAAIGYNPVAMPHAKGPAQGSYASSLASRTEDFLTAWMNPEIKAIICARGGYGAMQIIPSVPISDLRMNAKWLVGFSDISALHAMLHSAGVASIHGSMAKHFSEFGATDESAASIISIMEGEKTKRYSRSGLLEYDNPGEARGELRGGNLAVLNGLASTPFDMLSVGKDEKVILFIEDIAEPIYKVDRVLWRLYMSGTLNRLAGLVIGQFTEYKPDMNFSCMEEMISSRLKHWGIDIPVLADFPCGHTDRNLPLVQGARAEIKVTPKESYLEMNMQI